MVLCPMCGQEITTTDLFLGRTIKVNVIVFHKSCFHDKGQELTVSQIEQCKLPYESRKDP